MKPPVFALPATTETRELDARLAEFFGWVWVTMLGTSRLYPPDWGARELEHSWCQPGRLSEQIDLDSSSLYDSSKGGACGPVVPHYTTKRGELGTLLLELQLRGVNVSLNGGRFTDHTAEPCAWRASAMVGAALGVGYEDFPNMAVAGAVVAMLAEVTRLNQPLPTA